MAFHPFFFRLITFVFILISALVSYGFTAASFVTAGSGGSSSLNLNLGAVSDFSIEFRIKTNGWTGDPSIISNKDWNNGLNEGFNIALGSGGSGIDVNVGDGSNRADIEAGSLADGLWHHVLVTFDRNALMSLYIDGSLIQSVVMSSVGSINSAYNLAIAQDGTGAYPYDLNAALAEVRIWNKVLPVNELERCDTLNSSHPSWNDLLHYWKFNEGSGTVANPSKGAFSIALQSNTWITNQQYSFGCTQGSAVDAVGAGYALDFDGFDDYVSIQSNPLLRPTQAVTVESWVYIRNLGQNWVSLLSYAQDNGGNESGYDFSFINSKLRFRLVTVNMGSGVWDNNPGFTPIYNQWLHIAGTYDGQKIRFYLNGVLIDSSAQTGNIDWTNLPQDLRIGAYHDDNEDYYAWAVMDEVRIWNTARTENQIRSNMCSKLSGIENGLIALYRFDEASGIEAFDSSPNGLHGVLTNMNANNDWILSGAALGDESQFSYPSSWNSVFLNLTTQNRGEVSVRNINGVGGIHLYRVNETPISTNGVFDPGQNDTYFGVFPSDPSTSFAFEYQYSNYNDAVTSESSIGIYNRNANNSIVWVSAPTLKNISTNTITLNSTNGRKEFFLADFTSPLCPIPSSFSLDNVTFNTADISWNASGSDVNIQYGFAGFQLGNGTNINLSGTSLYTLSSLSGNNSYDVYLRSYCLNGDTSAWIGPLSFSTLDPCPAPTDVSISDLTSSSVQLTWTSINEEWIIEWGPSSVFTEPGFGIQTTVSDTPFILSGLLPLTEYIFFVKSICSPVLSSPYTGPYSFTTDDETGIEQVSMTWSVYPNPAEEWINIFGLPPHSDIIITDLTGRRVYQSTNTVQPQLTISLSHLSQGVYLLSVNSQKEVIIKK